MRDQFYHYHPRGLPTSKLSLREQNPPLLALKAPNFGILTARSILILPVATAPNILRHRHPEYIESLNNLIEANTLVVGGCFGFTENDVALAKKLTQHIPSAELVKLTTSGIEAIQVAMRVARSYTGRPYVFQFEGHYHGWLDNSVGPYINKETNGQLFAVTGNRELG